VILCRHWFCSFTSGAREPFAKRLPLGPMPQIWALYSIVGFTTAVYNRRVCLKEGPHVKTVICDIAANAVAFLWVACVIYVFQFSLESTQTPRTLRLASGFALQFWMFTVEAKSFLACFFFYKINKLVFVWCKFCTMLLCLCDTPVMHLV